MTSISINLDSLTSSQGIKFTGTLVNGNLGAAVSGLGDVNNDGYDDFIVSAPNAGSGGGVSYVIYGTTNHFGGQIAISQLGTKHAFQIAGGVPSIYSGSSVSGLGDINNDGYDDIIIGAPYANSNAGQSFIIYGNKTNSGDLNLLVIGPYGVTIDGAQAGDQSGCSVSGVGDINHDGYDDMLIGAWQADDTKGSSYMLYGSKSLPPVIHLSDVSQYGIKTYGALYSYSGGVQRVGDVNGDGYVDILIGYGYNGVCVIFGAALLPKEINLANLTISLGFTMFGPKSSEAGYSFSGLGDINKDGYDDLIVGTMSIGDSYVVYGNKSMPGIIELDNLGTQGIYIYGPANSGAATGGIGDFNGDGYNDILIGAGNADPNGRTNAGLSFVIFGNKTLPSTINLDNLNYTQGISFQGANAGDGSSKVSFAGDFNNDGYDDLIIGAPAANSNMGEVYLIYGGAFISSAPTSFPTTMPTIEPEESTQPTNTIWYNTLEFKTASSFALPVLSFVTAYVFRNKIAMYILDNWSHNYVLYNPYISLKENEIGIKLSLNNQLICIVKFKEYILLDIDHDNHGISKLLYNTIRKSIESPHISQSFTLLQSEKNQIRDYLIAHKYIQTTQTLCCLKSYNELGYVKGTLYNFFLNSFEAEHSRISKKQARSDSVAGGISMETLSTNSALDGQDNSAHTINPIIKDATQLDDVENHATVYAVPNIRYNTPLLNHPQASEIFKYAHEIGSTKAVNTLLDYQGYISNDINEIKDTIKEIFADGNPKAKPMAPSSTSNNLMISLLSAQQLVEYIPIIKYVAQGFNLSLPEVLDNKPILITTHLILGNAAAALLPYESISNGVITSTIATSSYAMRLVSASYLAEQRQDALAQDKPMSSFEMAKYCGASILAYTLPSLAKCAITKWLLPEAECSFTGYDLYHFS